MACSKNVYHSLLTFYCSNRNVFIKEIFDLRTGGSIFFDQRRIFATTFKADGWPVQILGQMISDSLIPKPLFDPDTKYMRS